MDLERIGGKTRWMGAPVEVGEVEEGFQGWGHQGGGFLRWIRMDLEGTLAVMVDQVVATTLSLGLEEWVRVVVGAEAGTRVVEADVMGGTGEVGVGMEVRGGMMIAIVIVITLGEVMTAEGEEASIEVVEAVTVNVGEVAEAAVGDTKYQLRLIYPQPYWLSYFAHAVPSLDETRSGTAVVTEY